MKASFFSRKQLESESLAEVQFVIDSCGLVSRSNYLNNSSKDCDWLILVCFIKEQCTTDATFTSLENEVWFQNSAECVGKFLDSLSQTNKEASTVLCSVVKNSGRGRAFKK